MCNPRRIEVTLSSEIEEAWSAPIEVEATAHAEVVERVERTMDLRRRLGPTAQAALREALEAGFRGWVRQGNAQFVLDRGPVTLTYDAKSGLLGVQVEARALVEAQAVGRTEVHEVVRGTLEVKGVARGYDDDAPEVQAQRQQQAQEDAQRKHEAEKAAFVEEQTRDAVAKGTERATAEAKRQAQVQAEEKAKAARSAVRAEAQAMIQKAAAPLVHEEVSALTGEVMRRSVRRLVEANDGYIQEEREDDHEIVIEAILQIED